MAEHAEEDVPPPVDFSHVVVDGLRERLVDRFVEPPDVDEVRRLVLVFVAPQAQHACP